MVSMNWALTSLMVLAAAEQTPEGRALAYLAKEVPAWSPEHKCYSCHNNGDGARALYTGLRLGLPLPAKTLDDTTRWLADPERWDKNGGDGPFNDRKLARIQFAHALVEASAAKQIDDPRPLQNAAKLVADLQDADGSWNVGGEGGVVGHPATYGPFLATAAALRTLRQADPPRYRKAIARAEAWLTSAKVESMLDAAAVLIALDGHDADDAKRQRQRCLELIRKGQAKDGGWGPFATSPPEPFDTAVVLLALVRQPASAENQERLSRGRAFLVACQEADGSWPPTTRPPGADSYAERISTTGWATLALLAVPDAAAKRPPRSPAKPR